MAGLPFSKHTYNFSDEVLCECWPANPYYQFLGKAFFQHRLLSMRGASAWARRSCKRCTRRASRSPPRPRPSSQPISPVIVDTTVQPKNVMFRTDVRLLNRARDILGGWRNETA
jgi:transposase, IS5 family